LPHKCIHIGYIYINQGDKAEEGGKGKGGKGGGKEWKEEVQDRAEHLEEKESFNHQVQRPRGASAWRLHCQRACFKLRVRQYSNKMPLRSINLLSGWSVSSVEEKRGMFDGGTFHEPREQNGSLQQAI